MKKILAGAVALLMLCGADTPPPAPSVTVDLAEAFGARPAVEHLSLSPDGTMVAFIVPATGQGDVLYTLSTQPGARQQVALVASGNPERLSSCSWVSNTRLVCTIFGVEKDVDQILPFTRIVAVGADGSNIKMLSTKGNFYSRGVQLSGGEVLDWLPGGDNAVLMSRNYIPDDHLGSHVGSSAEGLGVDRVDTTTLAISRIETPRKDVETYISDGRGTVRVMGRVLRDGSGYDTGKINYYYRVAGSREWAPLSVVNVKSQDGFTPVAIDYERNAAYGYRKKDGRVALYRIALDGSAKEELVYARPDVDVDDLVTIGRRHRVVGISYVTDIRHIEYFDPALNKLATALAKALPRQPLVRIVDASEDENKLLIWAGSDTDPGVYHIFDRTTRELAIFSVVRPQLEPVKLATVKPISYPAADGTMVPAYLTLPVDGTGHRIPAIVLPHGGPGARDEWGFDWLSQYYAARGYAVLQPNFRGSTGYGDAWFKDNGFKSWKTAIGDVADAGHWLVAQGIADPAKLAIVGWSYGGYAALQSAVAEPGLFKAVVAIAPVTDLAALKEESRYWSNFYLVGDFIGSGPHIREGSPAENADRIKAPVLLFHAALDRNVRQAESRLMDSRLKAAGVPHELVTWDKLDHYLDDSAARALLLRKSDAFLRASMGM